MDNQHKLIKGYRDLTQNEIDKMNKVKEIGVLLMELTNSMRQDGELDQRWVSEGITDLQKGLMSLTRSIAKPGFF